MRPNILVIGSSNTDMIVKVPRIPRPGETILGGEFSTASGGKGANQAVAASRAGGEVTFLTCVGSDSFGDHAIGEFLRVGISVNYIRRRRGPNGVALIFVGEDGQNSIAVAPGANSHLSPADVRRARPAFLDADALLVQLEIPMATVVAAVKLAVKQDVPVILNPAPSQKLNDELLGQVSILTPNEIEAESLTGVKVTNPASAKRAAQSLHRRGVKCVVMTLGARGAFVSSSGTQEFVPGFRVKAVDSTAAGDVFNSALAVGLGERMDLCSAARFANAAAAISVTRLGAQPSAPKRKEIEHFLNGKNGSLS